MASHAAVESRQSHATAAKLKVNRSAGALAL